MNLARNAESYEKWKKMYNSLRIIESESLLSEIKCSILTFLKGSSLCEVWMHVISAYTEKNHSTFMIDCLQIILAHRQFTRFEILFESDSYYDSYAISSLLTAFDILLSSGEDLKLRFSCVLKCWPDAFGEQIAFHYRNATMNTLDSLFSNEVVERFCRIIIFSTESDLYISVLTKLITLLHSRKKLSDFLNILIQKPCKPSHIHLFLAHFDKFEIFNLVDSVSYSWSRTEVVNSKPLAILAHLTQILSISLALLSSNDLQLVGKHGIPVILLLSGGISTYLECCDPERRMFGMQIANILSVMTLQEPVFQKESVKLSSSAPASSVPLSVDSDSSDLEELESYELQLSEVVRNPTQLLSCLDVLRDRESSSIYTLEDAVRSIPSILSNFPTDAEEVCPSLVQELLRIAFSSETLLEYSNCALIDMLSRFPEVIMPIFDSSLNLGSESLNSKLNILTLIAKASISKSNILGQEDTTDDSSKDHPFLRKTRLKSPIKLLKSSRERPCFRNEFGLVASTYFQPVLLVIVRVLAGTTANLSFASNLSKVHDACEYPELYGRAATSLDEMTSVLPSQALLTLLVIVKCAINSPVQRVLLKQAYEIAFAMKDMIHFLAIRRSVSKTLVDLISTFPPDMWFESWFSVENLAHWALTTLRSENDPECSHNFSNLVKLLIANES